MPPPPSPVRAEVIEAVADQLLSHGATHPHSHRVAIDGITAAGKTTFARELCAALRRRARPVDHVSMDDFHNPRAYRHRRGRDSADGYYQDAYNFAAARELLLDPLGPSGDGRYRRRVHDLASDAPIEQARTQAQPELIVVVDGSFLQNRRLAGGWDDVIFLHTDFDVALRRAIARDSALFGGAAETERAYTSRYHPACRAYLRDIHPQDSATVVIDNNDVSHPVVLRAGTRLPGS